MRHKKNKNASLHRLVFFSIAFILLYIGTQIIDVEKISEQFLATMDGVEYANVEQFKDSDTKKYQKEFQGFWSRVEKHDKMTVIDRLEIKENGYIWKVRTSILTLPSQRDDTIHHVYHGFLHPLSKSALDTTQISCVLRNLTQMWIQQNDTCVVTRYMVHDYVNNFNTVATHLDEDATVERSGDTLLFKKKIYEKYTGSLNTMFPPNLVSTLHNQRNRPIATGGKEYYYEDDGSGKGKLVVKNNKKSSEESVLTIIKECGAGCSQGGFIRDILSKEFENDTLTERINETVTQYIKEFYFPWCIRDEIDFAFYNYDLDAYHIEIEFKLLADGSVTDVRVAIPDNAVDRKQKSTEIRFEVEKWRFPHHNSDKSVRITYSDKVYKPQKI